MAGVILRFSLFAGNVYSDLRDSPSYRGLLIIIPESGMSIENMAYGYG